MTDRELALEARRQKKVNDAARRERKLEENARYLQEHKAYFWVWPDKRGRWQQDSKVSPAKRPPCVYKGPSKSVVARRKRKGHKVNATRFTSATAGAQ